ncbi:hypothetical protein CYLTODRAFT_440463 [Cylindrobasidium torrendii FP15055 ss-10]|uniref:RING-type domain-containing protein n=1 Tax=Cylindrobasidium torrendii FP15055 ss-10 TaxID=1314674 RepID=A0A0D7BSF1_9AGAR|nr:hypothetical protein CYLTODRAFT_440463 [Cylindrobasidium torrendii FP15055 ss-10]
MASSSSSNWRRSPPLVNTSNRKRSWEDTGREMDPEDDEEDNVYTLEGRSKRARRESSAEAQDNGAGPAAVAAESSHASGFASMQGLAGMEGIRWRPNSLSPAPHSSYVSPPPQVQGWHSGLSSGSYQYMAPFPTNNGASSSSTHAVSPRIRTPRPAYEHAHFPPHPSPSRHSSQMVQLPPLRFALQQPTPESRTSGRPTPVQDTQSIPAMSSQTPMPVMLNPHMDPNQYQSGAFRNTLMHMQSRARRAQQDLEHAQALFSEGQERLVREAQRRAEQAENARIESERRQRDLEALVERERAREVRRNALMEQLAQHRMPPFASRIALSPDFSYQDSDDEEDFLLIDPMDQDEPQGTSPEVLATLKTMPYAQLPVVQERRRKASGADAEEDCCPICLEDYTDDAVVTKLNQCSHYLHGKCIADWLQRADTCPICRQSVGPRPLALPTRSHEFDRLTAQERREAEAAERRRNHEEFLRETDTRWPTADEHPILLRQLGASGRVVRNPPPFLQTLRQGRAAAASPAPAIQQQPVDAEVDDGVGTDSSTEVGSSSGRSSSTGHAQENHRPSSVSQTAIAVHPGYADTRRSATPDFYAPPMSSLFGRDLPPRSVIPSSHQRPFPPLPPVQAPPAPTRRFPQYDLPPPTIVSQPRTTTYLQHQHALPLTDTRDSGPATHGYSLDPSRRSNYLWQLQSQRAGPSASSSQQVGPSTYTQRAGPSSYTYTEEVTYNTHYAGHTPPPSTFETAGPPPFSHHYLSASSPRPRREASYHSLPQSFPTPTRSGQHSLPSQYEYGAPEPARTSYGLPPLSSFEQAPRGSYEQPSSSPYDASGFDQPSRPNFDHLGSPAFGQPGRSNFDVPPSLARLAHDHPGRSTMREQIARADAELHSYQPRSTVRSEFEPPRSSFESNGHPFHYAERHLTGPQRYARSSLEGAMPGPADDAVPSPGPGPSGGYWSISREQW